jgi:hypothetical protein
VLSSTARSRQAAYDVVVAFRHKRRSSNARLTRVSNYRWTLGSILFLSSFAAMMGPWAYLQHLASTPRLPFTAAYFGSLGLTLYFSIGVSDT